MSNENKTALTAEEIKEEFYKCMPFKDVKLTSCDEDADLIVKMEKLSAKQCYDVYLDLIHKTSLQTKDKDKEIEQCKNLANIQQKRWIERNEKLQSTIESQQKEIEELKTSIEGVFGWREKNHHLTISEKQLKSQLSEVTKERDRIKGGYLKVLTMLNEILTPTKE